MIAALMTYSAAFAAPAESEEDLRRRVEDQKKVIEELEHGFDFKFGTYYSLREYYARLYDELKSLKSPLPGTSDWSPLAPSSRDAVALVLQKRRDDIRAFAPKAKGNARDLNDAVKCFLGEVELLRSAAPNAIVPAVGVKAGPALQDWKKHLAYSTQTSLSERNLAYRRWKQEFDNLIAQATEFNSNLATRTLVMRYIDEFNKLGLDESPGKYTESDEFQRLRHIVVTSENKTPPLLVQLMRVQWRWRYFELERGVDSILREHLKEIEAVLSTLESGLDEGVWDRLANPPLPKTRKVTVYAGFYDAGDGLLPKPPGGLEVQVIAGSKVFKTRLQDAHAGPFEIETAAGLPEVTGRFEYEGNVFVPSRVEIKQDGPDPNQFLAALYFDLSAVQPSVWLLSGEVVDKAGGNPVGGATVKIRESALTTGSTGQFGPVEIPAEVESVGITVNVTANGKVIGASAGARKPEGGRTFVQIPLEIPQSISSPTVSFTKAFFSPSKDAYDVGDEVQFLVSYEIDGIPDRDSFMLSRKYRIRGKSHRYPTDGGWIVDQVAAQAGPEVLTKTFEVTPDFLSGDYTIEVVLEGQGASINGSTSLAFHVSGLYAGLVYLIQTGTDLVAQCKPFDAEAVLNQVPAAVGSRTHPLYVSLRYRAEAEIVKAQTAAGQMASILEKLEHASALLRHCHPAEAKKTLDSVNMTGLPEGCLTAVREKAAPIQAEADERLNNLVRMRERFAAGKAEYDACKFSEAEAAFTDPVFSSSSSCEEESRLASEAKSYTSEAQRREKLAQSLGQQLRKAADAFGSGRRQEVEKLAKQIVAAIDGDPAKACFGEQRNKALALLSPKSPTPQPVLGVAITGERQALQNRQASIGSLITVNGVPVKDPDSYTYRWETSDGKSVTGKKSVTFTPRAPGQKTIRLTVADAQGRSATGVIVITVPKLPKAVISADKGKITTGTKITLTASVAEEGEQCPCTYEWQASGESRQFTSKSIWFKYKKPGNYGINLTVKDRFGQTATAAYAVVVEKDTSKNVQGLSTAARQRQKAEEESLRREREVQERTRQRDEAACRERERAEEQERLRREAEEAERERQRQRADEEFWDDLRYRERALTQDLQRIEAARQEEERRSREQYERDQERFRREQEERERQNQAELERQRREEQERRRQEERARIERENQIRALQENMKQWQKELDCLLKGKEIEPYYDLDCTGHFTMGTRDSNISRLKGYIEAGRRKLEALGVSYP